MALMVGDKAPDFTLYNTDKEQVTLSALRGKNVVLMFFPLAFTSVCTAQLCTMRDSIATYQNLDAEVLGISVDSVFTLEVFKKKEALPFDLLSDFNKTVSADYGALYDEFVMGMKGVSKRAGFLIDKEGVVRYAEVLDDAGNMPDFNKIQQALLDLPK